MDATCVAVVSQAPTWSGDELPDWAQTLELALALGEESSTGHDAAADLGNEIPFAQVFRGFQQAAETTVDAAWARSGLLGPGALDRMKRQLVADLSAAAGPVLNAEFESYRHHRLGSLGAAIVLHAAAPPTDLLPTFIAELLQGGWRSLIQRYPMCGRLLAQRTLAWIGLMTELVHNVTLDRPALSRELDAEGRITSIVAAGSDSHNGRHVLFLRFENGVRLVYKPRSVAAELALLRICEAVSDVVPGTDLRSPKTIDRESHGWVEFIDSAECADEASVRSVYRQAGALMALFFAVGGGDLHYENVLCDGSHFVVVDAEMLAVPIVGEAEPDTAHELGNVLQTMLLPNPNVTMAGDVYDSGGLTPTPVTSARSGRPGWVSVGTDAMRLKVGAETRGNTVDHQRVHRGGLSIDPAEYVEDIVAGFRDTYGALQRRPALVLDVLDQLPDMKIRWLARNTLRYSEIRVSCRRPEAMKDGFAATVAADRLADLGTMAPRDLRPTVARSELRQLLAGDIPFFLMPLSATSIETGDGDLPVVPSPAHRIRQRLAALCEADRDRQVSLIRQSLVHLRRTEKSAVLPPPGSRTADPLEAALAVGHSLERDAIVDAMVAMRLRWMSAVPLANERAWRLEQVGADLYSGQVGVAVFLSGLFAVTGDHRWRELVLRALPPDWNLSDAFDTGRLLGHGLRGAPGLAYAFTLCDRLIGEPRYAATARELMLGLQQHSGPTRCVIFNGAAGSALLASRLGLLNHPDHAKLATGLREQLLACQPETPAHAACWARDGYANGAAGVGVGMTALGLDPPGRAVEPPQPAGPDEISPHDQGAWCSTQPGRALAHAQLHSMGAALENRYTSDAVVDEYNEFGPIDDTLCCGAAGMIDVLRYLASDGDAEADSTAESWSRALAGRVVAGHGKSRRMRPRAADPQMPVPGLFTGDSGIGWVLLRSAAPNLPNLLNWELPVPVAGSTPGPEPDWRPARVGAASFAASAR